MKKEMVVFPAIVLVGIAVNILAENRTRALYQKMTMNSE